MAIAFGWLRNDHELLFGCATVFVLFAAVAAFVAVFLHSNIQDDAGLTFLLLAGVGIILLILVAHDWDRGHLVIAVLVISAALSFFVMRVGFDSLKVPPRWERTQTADRWMLAARSIPFPQYPSPPGSLAVMSAPSLWMVKNEL